MLNDDKNKISLHVQLREQLAEKITSGEWSLGDKIPTERQLCDLYGVSRITVRQALSDLERAGYLMRRQGKGTFVTAPRVVQPLNRFYSFTQELRQRGMLPSAKMLCFEMRQAGEEIGRFLGLKPDDLVLYISRIRMADGQPFGLETSWVPYELFKKITVDSINEVGLYEAAQEHCGIYPEEATETFEAITLTGNSRKLLEAAKGAPGLKLERISYWHNQPVEYCESIIRGDKYRYTVTLKR